MSQIIEFDSNHTCQAAPLLAYTHPRDTYTCPRDTYMVSYTWLCFVEKTDENWWQIPTMQTKNHTPPSKSEVRTGPQGWAGVGRFRVGFGSVSGRSGSGWVGFGSVSGRCRFRVGRSGSVSCRFRFWRCGGEIIALHSEKTHETEKRNASSTIYTLS